MSDNSKARQAILAQLRKRLSIEKGGVLISAGAHKRRRMPTHHRRAGVSVGGVSVGGDLLYNNAGAYHVRRKPVRRAPVRRAAGKRGGVVHNPWIKFLMKNKRALAGMTMQQKSDAYHRGF